MSENEEVGYKSLFTATGFSYYVFVSAVEFISRECYWAWIVIENKNHP